MPDTAGSARAPLVLSASTARVGIVGWPVGHSQSPSLHNAVHAALGIDAHYHLLPTPPEALPTTLAALVELGWRGVNVTIPHKVAAMEACDEVSGEAALIGAVNVISFTDGRRIGDNTDARGYLASLRDETDWSGGGRAVVVGTGGAARAVIVGLAQQDTHVTVVGRGLAAAEQLAELAARAGAPGATALELGAGQQVEKALENADLVVNATPVGMHGDSLGSAFEQLREGQIASDLVYRPRLTPLLRAAAAAGAATHGGFGMLVAQAALSFACWHGGAVPLAAFARAGEDTPE